MALYIKQSVIIVGNKQTASQIAMNIEQVNKVFLAFLLTKPANRVIITIPQLINHDMNKNKDNNDIIRDVDQPINMQNIRIVASGVIFESISKLILTKGIDIFFDIKNIEIILNNVNE